MLGIHDLALFVTSGLLLNITPGADSLYIATRSVSQGWRAGTIAALGISAGCCVHIFAAALGLSALLAASAAAFTAVKIGGGIYLLYIGISLLRDAARAPNVALTAVAPVSLRNIFTQGFLTNVLNPKVALFFLAFMPQFIAPSAPHKALAFLVLGAIFNFNGTLWCLFLAWITARLHGQVAHSDVVKWLNRTVGGLFVFLGYRLVVARQG